MKLLRFSFSALCLIFSLSAGAQNIFMKVQDPSVIPGESLNETFKNWTNIEAFNAGSDVDINAIPGGGSGRPATKCFTFSMPQDKVGYYFKREMYTGSPIANIQFDFIKSTGTGQKQTYYRVYMEDIMVTAIEEAATDGDGMIKMNVSVVPQKFRYTYWPQLNNGQLGTPVIFGWDVAGNKPWN